MATLLDSAIEHIRKYAPNHFPKLGIILGSGLGGIAEQLTNVVTIPYQALGLTSGGVAGHASLLVLGNLNDVPVVCLKGRLHLYEGTKPEIVATLIRIIKHLGAKGVIVTGAAGSLRSEVGPGELMMITDHINFQGINPLIGPNDESMGPRFVSLEDAYDPEFAQNMKSVAGRMQIPLHQGVYFATMGPVFETPAEIRAFKMLGADAVGMSVVPEVILARHVGLKVAGIAAITNFAVGMSPEKVTHDVTLQYAELGARKLIKLIPEYVKELGNIVY